MDKIGLEQVKKEGKKFSQSVFLYVHLPILVDNKARSRRLEKPLVGTDLATLPSQCWFTRLTRRIPKKTLRGRRGASLVGTLHNQVENVFLVLPFPLSMLLFGILLFF